MDKKLHIILKIAILLAGIWAALRPAVYGALFILIDSSALIDLLVLGSCIIIVWDTFRTLTRFMWIASFTVLLVSTNIGLFHYFSEFESSGPRPYEWLNGYYEYTLPLITLALLNRFLRWRFTGSKEDNTINGIAEQRH